MAIDVNKYLERARRSLEKNKLREAAAEYQLVYEAVPTNLEALQALADIHTRLNEPSLAAPYYGAQFDRLLDAGDATKASAIFNRFLRAAPQPPDRLLRYATLLQKQNRTAEATEQYASAAELFLQQQRQIEALACYESMAVLDPENPARHVILGELAERLKHADLATRSYLRAGQLVLAVGGLDEALDCYGRAYTLSPNDRAVGILYAEARLRKGDPEGAVALLDPFTPSDNDTTFLALYGEALLRSGHLDRAAETFQTYYRQKPDSYAKLFEVASGYLKSGDEAKASALLADVRSAMISTRKEAELSAQLEKLAAAYPASLPLAETIAHTYEELNREAKYFDALVHLFDLYMIAGRIQEACDALDRLVDIDPYDYRNQQRIASLEGKVDPAFLQNILSRAAKAATVSTRTDGFAGVGSETGAAVPASDEARAQQALDDLMVQVEIFLQYSLLPKAVERLEKISQLFPDEEETNERLRALYERANWWPKGVPTKPKPAAAPPVPQTEAQQPVAPPPPSASSAADTHRDLTAIAEVNRMMYRQPTPREVLSTTAAQVGRHLNATRCLIAMGTAGEAGQVIAEFAAPGLAAVGAPHASGILSMLSNASPDALGGIEISGASNPALQAMGLESALGVILTDKETQSPVGALLAGDAKSRKWKPNESFFMQAVGDQLVMSVSHSRLRSLVRSLAVADEKTGILSRSAYLDCLLVETNRARTQGTPLSLLILQLDRGTDLLRQHGDAMLEQYVDQLARSLTASVRQTDIAVKYTAWSLVFILPDTLLENARGLAEKLRQVAVTVNPPWGGDAEINVSAVVAEASSRPGDETEDRVTEWINRAELGLDEVRHRGGNTLIPLPTP